jgi:hypothetical protein
MILQTKGKDMNSRKRRSLGARILFRGSQLLVGSLVLIAVYVLLHPGRPLWNVYDFTSLGIALVVYWIAFLLIARI